MMIPSGNTENGTQYAAPHKTFYRPFEMTRKRLPHCSKTFITIFS